MTRRFFNLPLPYDKNVTGMLIAVAVLLVLTLSSCNIFVAKTDAVRALSSTAENAIAGDAITDDKSVATSPETENLSPDPTILYERLSNGLGVVLMQNREPKDRVSMHLVVHAGSLNEAEDQEGFAHFLEHMMFNGSKHFPPGELVKYFQNIGMTFGPDANAHTGFDETVYDVLLPFGDRENIENGLLVMKDYAQGALLLPEEVERERRVILSEKRSRDSVDYRTMVATLKHEFPNARLSKRLPIGDEEDILAAGQASLRLFYDTWYRPDRMTLVLVGDFDIELANSLIRSKMSDIAPRKPPLTDPPFGKINHHGVQGFYHYEPESGATTVSIEVVQQVPAEDDSVSLRRETLYRQMAFKIVQDRLAEKISDPQTPFTDAHINSGRFLNEVLYAEISAECPPESWQASLGYIEKELRQALVHGFNTVELERVEKEIIADLDNSVKEATTRKSGDLARQIIWHLNNRRVMIAPIQEKELLTPFVQKATLSDLHVAFQKAWPASHRLVLLTGNAVVGNDDALSAVKEIVSCYSKSGKEVVQKPVEKAAKHFPYLPLPEGNGHIQRNEYIADLGIRQIDFENGVRLNIKKTDYEAGKVRASIAFGNGRFSEPAEKAGIVLQGVDVMNEGGLGTLDKNELAHALAGKEVVARYVAEEDKFAISGAGPSEEQLLLVQLLYAHLVDPAFRKEAHLVVLERAEQQYESLHREIDGEFKLQGPQFLASGDSRFGLPPFDNVKSISLKDIRSWMVALLKHSSIEISVVGDLDEASLISAVRKYFGALPKRSDEQNCLQRPMPKFPAGDSLRVPVDTKIPKGLVVVAYPTDDFWDIGRTRRLSVLASIFSERMREKIREKLGASYSPFAYNRSSRAYKGYGLMQAFVYVSPEEYEIVIAAVRDIAEDIVQEGISQEEMDRSLKPILTRIKDYRRTNDYWLNSVLSGSLRHPEQLEWSRGFMEDYEAIAVEELQQIATTYLRNDRAATVVVLPDSREKETGA